MYNVFIFFQLQRIVKFVKLIQEEEREQDRK